MQLSASRSIHCAVAVLSFAVCLLSQSDSRAQATPWPSKPIRLIAVFPPGGSVDQVARILAPALSAQLGQNVIVENRGGASGSIGTQAVAKAEPDGYTIGLVFDTHAVNPSLIPSMGFDTLKDLSHVSLIGTAPMAIAASAKSDFRTFSQVLQAAKEKGKGPNYGTIGAGSLGHLALALFGRANGFELNHVPYKGGGPMLTDLVAGHVPLGIGSVFLMKPQIDSQALRPLAVTSAKRAPDLPQVPTIAESGFPGFEAPAWWGVIAPANLPPGILQRLNTEIVKALKTPAIAQKLDQQGIDVVGSSPAVFTDFVKKQMDTWSKVVKENNITPGS